MVERHAQRDRATVRVADKVDVARNRSGKSGDPSRISGDDIFVEAVPRWPGAMTMEIRCQHVELGFELRA
jgi:hypothetical protein